MGRSPIVIIARLAVAIGFGVLLTAASGAIHGPAMPEWALSALDRESTWGETADCSQPPTQSSTSTTCDLDQDAAAWGVHCEGTPTWTKENVATPSLDGRALRCAITGGEPYSNVHCYVNLPPEPTAMTFTLGLSFWFSPTTTFNNQGSPSVIQALEFTMNKWHQSKRYEWAVQWQNVGAGAPQWRYWDPGQAEPWVSLGITGTLQGEQWHTLTLAGKITGDCVHYHRFSINQQSYDLDLTAPLAEAPEEADRLAVAFQLDGNSEQSPYHVIVDQVCLERQPVIRYLPLIMLNWSPTAARSIETSP